MSSCPVSGKVGVIFGIDIVLLVVITFVLLLCVLMGWLSWFAFSRLFCFSHCCVCLVSRPGVDVNFWLWMFG